MNLNYNSLESLQRDFLQLPRFHQIVFSASCCERLLPNYYAFSRQEGRGNYSLLRTGLDTVWNILLGQFCNIEEIANQLKNNCIDSVFSEEIIPKSPYSYEAELAALAVHSTIELFIKDNNLELQVMPLICTVDTVTEHVRILKEINDPNWENKSYEDRDKEVFNHPFVVREITRQREDLQKLKKTKELNSDFVESIRNSFDNNGKSLIDLP